MTSHYETLGIPEDATPEEIKKAYKKQSHKHHPDRNGDSVESNKQMMLINEAYDTLKDESRRDNYNRTGEDGKEPSMESQALTQLSGLFAATIDQVSDLNTADIKEAMRRTLVMQIDNLERQARDQKNIIIKLHATAGRIKSKNEKPNIFQNVVDEKLKCADLAIIGITKHKVLTELMQEILKDYDYEFDKPVPPERISASGSWGTGTFGGSF